MHRNDPRPALACADRTAGRDGRLHRIRPAVIAKRRDRGCGRAARSGTVFRRSARRRLPGADGRIDDPGDTASLSGKQHRRCLRNAGLAAAAPASAESDRPTAADGAAASLYGDRQEARGRCMAGFSAQGRAHPGRENLGYNRRRLPRRRNPPAHHDTHVSSDAAAPDSSDRRYRMIGSRALIVVLFGLALAGCAGWDNFGTSEAYREGRALAAEGRIEERLAKLQEAMRQDPRNPEYRMAYHTTYERAITGWLALGDRLRFAGRPADAAQFYQRVLALEPTNARARAALDE